MDVREFLGRNQEESGVPEKCRLPDMLPIDSSKDV